MLVFFCLIHFLFYLIFVVNCLICVKMAVEGTVKFQKLGNM